MAKTRSKKGEEPKKLSPHGQLIQDCENALDALISDTSVSPRETLRDLQGVSEHLDVLYDALRSTIQAREADDYEEEEGEDG